MGKQKVCNVSNANITRRLDRPKTVIACPCCHHRFALSDDETELLFGTEYVERLMCPKCKKLLAIELGVIATVYEQ
jgi:RNase P subunit RPR2